MFRLGAAGWLEVECIARSPWSKAREHTGFALRVPPGGVLVTPDPTARDLESLETLDPHCARVASFA